MDYYWNPWHGCHKISPGCQNCYVYSIDGRHGKNAFEVKKNADFDLPVQRNKNGYKIPSGSMAYTCFSSDFLLDTADEWRGEAWRFIKERSDLKFLFITKRIHRFMRCIPEDWGKGYPNVTVGCTCENQEMAEYRIPYFSEAPIAHKFLVCEPLLERIDLSVLREELHSIEGVTVGGESGDAARVCDYDWVLAIRDFCATEGIGFSFHQTGARFLKNGKEYKIPKKWQREQAKRAEIDLL